MQTLVIALLATAVTADTSTAGVDTVSAASPGALEAEVGFDFLRANSSAEGGATVAGDPAGQVAQEAGMRLRLHVEELTRTLFLDVDYQGREPIGGDVKDSALRLLYRAELGYVLIRDTLQISAGRFPAASVNLLIIDGARVDLRFSKLTISPYGGRRAITTSRKNVDFGDFKPAAGVGASWKGTRYRVDAVFSYSRDVAIIGEASSDVDAASAFVALETRFLDELIAGGRVSFAQRASYVLGPTWSSLAVEALALDLWHGVAHLEWRPDRWIRVGYNFQTQATGVYRAAPAGSEPRFTDNELAIGVHLFDMIWARPKLRHRIRPDRKELRAGGSIDADDLFVRGLFARGFFAFEDVAFDDDTRPSLDRIVFSGSAGYRAEFGLELEAGVHYIDRAAGPLSARTAGVTAPVDLAPFIVEAQRIAFLRAFYADETWFGGLDVESNLEEPGELRVLAQAGLLVEATW